LRASATVNGGVHPLAHFKIANSTISRALRTMN
jgi:hypothetical protein